MPKIYVLNVPEFAGLVRDAAAQNYTVADTGVGYTSVEHPGELVFDRRTVGFHPAIWYAALCGGFEGEVAEHGRDTLRVVDC